MAQAEKLRRFLHWCHQHGHLDGLEYRHRGHGRGRLVANEDGRAGDTIGFKPDAGPKVSLSLGSIAERVMERGGLSETDRSSLLQKYKSSSNSKPNPSAGFQSQDPSSGDNSQAELTELYRAIDRHCSLLLTHEDENLRLFLREVGADILGLEWAKNIRDEIGKQHPQGITKRRSKRDRLVGEIERAIADATAAWWSNIDSHQTTTILEHLARIPEQHVENAIAKMVSLPYACHASFRDVLWEFYDHHFDRLVDQLSKLPAGLIGPSVLAYAGWLACRPKGKKRCYRLLELLENSEVHGFTPLIAFLRFLASDPPSLCGRMQFTDLDETDLFLAACYYPDDRMASDGLRKLSDWRLSTIRQKLDDQAYNDFLVRGVQPRIAELAFAQIRPRICGESGKGMTDLNRHAVQLKGSLGTTTKELPKADWKDSAGTSFDVKSNLYFRSFSPGEGLRGFAIKRPERDCVTYSGIVFFETSANHCAWAYVGDFSKECYQEVRGSVTEQDERVLPFVFQMPEQLRFSVDVPPEEAQRFAALLVDEQLIRAWTIASHQPSRHPTDGAPGPRLMDWFIDRFSALAAQFPIEFSLWKAITESTLHWCSCGRLDEVDAMLDEAISLLHAGLFPVRLARIGEETLLERWVHNVLKPLAKHFPAICCPVCNGKDISLKLNRITAGGALFGAMDCKSGCLREGGEITILTHCHACRAYPILIGKNKICPECRGLVCNSEHAGAYRQCGCGACKKHCVAGQARMTSQKSHHEVEQEAPSN